MILEAIRDKALLVTKICHLSSLLFLFKAQRAFEAYNITFFLKPNQRGKGVEANTNGNANDDPSGYDVIKGCFDAVLQTNINTAKMEPEFRSFVDSLDDENRFDWPNSNKMGNAMKDIVKQYVNSLKTNLYTHRKKRLREYLRIQVYKNNENVHRTVYYYESDINAAIAWAIHGIESIKVNHMDCQAKRQRRDGLLEIIR